jgi:hypothetical protein
MISIKSGIDRKKYSMPKSKLSYEETVEEIRVLQVGIKDHQLGKIILSDYVSSLKRLQFLRNSLRALKKQKAPEGK